MKRVFKYPLKALEKQIVAIPLGAQILCAQVQHGNICLWAFVDPEESPQERTIRIFGTGHNVAMDLDLAYIGTVQVEGGSFVFHVFEEVRS